MLAAQNLTLAGRLAGITTELHPGEVTAICGPNGAGKSSLLAALAGLLAGDQGAAMLDGAALSALPLDKRAQQIGYLPQSADVAWDVSVETLVALGRLPWRTGGAQDHAAVEAAIAAMQLGALRQRAVSQLSGGERARALLARVLAGEPRWLLADEPLANLDLAHQLALLAHFRALAERGPGVVLVLHDLAQAMNHADRVLVLSGGALVEDGPPQQALRSEAIARHWGVQAQWLGERGARALAII
ncbi:ABC transporter ATP-binding protein [Novosphingobium sp. B 225]|uniref:ABC transporter ATP-binding protein n=1 Tax=Novosphingobium sp. B 225 TaxID=1961849 RepID=UPI000B4B02F6|nr:ABC transporter ATP-binding protein [Novosphingobium sp. B 225]